jgi:hypothetical protein
MARSAWVPAFGVLAFGLLAACGGGGAAETTGGSSSQVTGKVSSRNGLPQGLAGVGVRCPEAGTTASTGADGSFRIDVPSGTPFRVDFDDPAALGFLDAFDCGETADPDEDGDDLRGDGVAIDALDRGESCDLEVAIVDGVVVAYRLSRDGAGAPERVGEGWLLPAGPDARLLGEVEVSREGDCWVVEVEVDCAIDPTGTYAVEVVAADGTTTALGTVALSAGGGHLRAEVCPDPDADLVPEDLRGAVVRVLDADGNVVLSGVIPDLEGEGRWDLPYGGGTDGHGGDGTFPWPDGFDLPDWLDDLPFGGGNGVGRG